MPAIVSGQPLLLPQQLLHDLPMTSLEKFSELLEISRKVSMYALQNVLTVWDW